MKFVIVCTTQRSGSTMVCEDMTRFGIGKPNEYFLPWVKEEALDWKAELEAMKARYAANGVFAVKIMANQVRRVDLRLSKVLDPVDDGPFPYFRAAFPDADWVYIQRQDTINQAISHFLAIRSGVYHVVRGKGEFMPGAAVDQASAKSQIVDVPYDYKALLEEWHRLQTGNLLWAEFFRTTENKQLEIIYETYDENSLRDFGTRLGISLQNSDGERNLTKMPGGRNLEIRERFLSDIFSRL